MKRTWVGRLIAFSAVLLMTVTWLNREPAAALPAATDVFRVGASVNIRCTLLTTALTFGTYTLTNPSPLDANASIALNCTNSIVNFIMHVRLSQGQFPGPGSTAANPVRRMSNGTSGRMRYNLYRDAARTQLWGDTISTAVFPGFSASPVNIPVYGRVPALQNLPPGSYTDVVLATLYF